MKTFVTLLLCVLSVSLFAQTGDEVRRAMDELDYEKVITLVGTDCKDSLLVSARIQALKAMNRYPEAITDLKSVLHNDSTNAKVLADLAECYKLIGNSSRAAEFYHKALGVRPENKFFRLQYIRSLLNSEDFETARAACHEWLELDSVSATGYKYLGQAYEGLQDAANAFFSYNLAYRRDSLDYQTVARIANMFNNNEQYNDALMVTECYRLTDTTSMDVNRQNAKAYCMIRNYKKAIDRYEGLKKLGDRSFTTYYYLGISYYGDNEFYGAHDNFEKAYQLNPNDINVLYHFGKSCSRTSWKKEGVECLEEAIRKAMPEDSVMSRLYKGLIECCGYAGDTYKKIEVMKTLYKLNKDYTLFYKIAREYDWKKDYANAVYFYEKYMTQVPKEKREPVYDEKGNPRKDVITIYQYAENRVSKIKEEDFFRNGASDDEFIKPIKIEKKDTATAKPVKTLGANFQ